MFLGTICCDVSGKALFASTGTPTLSGSSGHVSIVTGGNTWTNIMNATILSDVNSMSLVRKWA